MERTIRVMGVMSGTSLDGLDLASCAFTREDERWRFDVEAARTFPFPADLRSRLLAVMQGDALELARLHRDLGRTIGTRCAELMVGLEHGPDLISSHGHTIFHRPEEGLTTQIGCGAHIAAIAGVPVVSDLRTKDVALGGQGAPLVPVGERALFPGPDAFLNLGGIANLSVHREVVLGYDLSPCNQALDLLAAEVGLAYDANGAIARSGRVDQDLLQRLNALDFYAQPPPRSLGREWFEERFRPLIDRTTPLPDRMRTVAEHIATIAGGAIDRADARNVLVTGGGAHNALLIERIRARTRAQVGTPAREVIDFKEAIVFAFLGLLRWRGEANTLCSVTGARADSIGGAIHLPN